MAKHGSSDKLKSNARHGEIDEKGSSSKKRYTCPQLTVFGSVRKLTRGFAGAAMDGGTTRVCL